MKRTKCTVAVLAIVVIMLIAGIGTSIYFALMSYKQMQEVSQYITELQAEPKEEETRENDVKIAGSYEIKSTEAISDAYKNGDTSKLSDKERETLDMASGAEGDTGLPTSNVLYFALDNDAWCCARPSGTEPKIKFYMGVKGKDLEDAAKLLDELTAAVKKVIE